MKGTPMQPQTGSETPETTPAQPTEPTNQPAPASSPDPAPAQAPATPVEGQEPPAAAPAATEPTPTAEPAPAAQPEPVRESAQLRRAREAREKAQGLLGLANKLDPQPAQPDVTPAPVQAAPAAPALPSNQPEAPDYFDPDTNEIDPAKLAAYNQRETARQVQLALADRDAQAEAKANQNLIRQEVTKYADSVQSDAEYLSKNIDELNPSHANYDQALDDEIEADYRRMTMTPDGRLGRIDISLKEYAEAQVARARRYATKGQASIPNSTVAASMDTAITPGSGQAAASGGKSIEDMTADEYEAHLKRNGTATVRR